MKKGLIKSIDPSAEDSDNDMSADSTLKATLEKRRDKLAKTKLGIDPDAEDED